MKETSTSHNSLHEGRHREASRTLGKIYAWFTEGFDTADLRAARSLLDQLQTAT
jgi:hypothetical protein